MSVATPAPSACCNERHDGRHGETCEFCGEQPQSQDMGLCEWCLRRIHTDCLDRQDDRLLCPDCQVELRYVIPGRADGPLLPVEAWRRDE